MHVALVYFVINITVVSCHICLKLNLILKGNSKVYTKHSIASLSKEYLGHTSSYVIRLTQGDTSGWRRPEPQGACWDFNETPLGGLLRFLGHVFLSQPRTIVPCFVHMPVKLCV